jgi:hypothetical protein
MIAGIIAKPAIKENRPDNADQAEKHKRVPPGNEGEDPDDQQRGKGATPTGAHPHDPLRPDPLDGGQPHGKRLGQVRETAGLARAEHEPRDPERHQVPGKAGRRGEQRPHDHHPHQDLARAYPIAQPSTRDFEKRVGQGKRGKGQPHFLFRQAQIPADVGRRL